MGIMRNTVVVSQALTELEELVQRMGGYFSSMNTSASAEDSAQANDGTIYVNCSLSLNLSKLNEYLANK